MVSQRAGDDDRIARTDVAAGKVAAFGQEAYARRINVDAVAQAAMLAQIRRKSSIGKPSSSTNPQLRY